MNSQTASHQEPFPDWFTAAVSRGLSTLYLLSLEGCPAADSTKTVGALWAKLLWEKARGNWQEIHDKRRIADAFAAIATDAKRWPTPAVFLEHLPARPVNHKTGGELHPDWGRERQAEALECMYRQFEELGRDRNGTLVANHASTATSGVGSASELTNALAGLYGEGRA